MIKLTKTNGYFCIISQVIFNSLTLKHKIQAKNIYWHFFNFQKSLLRNRATYYVFTTQTNLYLDKLICTTPRLIFKGDSTLQFRAWTKLKGILSQTKYMKSLIFQLVFWIIRLNPLKSAAKSYEELVNQKLCNIVLMLDDL